MHSWTDKLTFACITGNWDFRIASCSNCLHSDLNLISSTYELFSFKFFISADNLRWNSLSDFWDFRLKAVSIVFAQCSLVLLLFPLSLMKAYIYSIWLCKVMSISYISCKKYLVSSTILCFEDKFINQIAWKKRHGMSTESNKHVRCRRSTIMLNMHKRTICHMESRKPGPLFQNGNNFSCVISSSTMFVL